jgi:hypothetical protein
LEPVGVAQAGSVAMIAMIIARDRLKLKVMQPLYAKD